MPAILFICTGNQCRSPVAEALLKQRLHQLALPGSWRIESAGTWTQSGRPAHPQMAQAAQTFGLDLSKHRARDVAEIPALADFDLILTMERGQQEALRIEFPHLSQRIRMLSALAGPPYDINDPLGHAPQQYLATLREIERLLEVGFPKLLAWLNQPPQ